ncbi:Agmatine hydroxycinnamoyltransferase 1 [Linum grandiflorum]
MKVKIETASIVKPTYDGKQPPSTTTHIPLSVFDKVTFDAHIAVIYVYRPLSTPLNSKIRLGLRRTLAEYQEFARRLGKDLDGNFVIFLNDEGVKFVEATCPSRLNQVMPLKPPPSVLSLHPGLKGVEELVQVQLTSFACGSLVVGFTSHHLVADGHSSSNFLVAWGLATRGLDVGPLPLHDQLVPTAHTTKYVLCPDLEVNSWLRFPFYDLDFGGGCPSAFMPSYFPMEGLMFLWSSFIGDGSIVAFVPLFKDNVDTFKQICYLLD